MSSRPDTFTRWGTLTNGKVHILYAGRDFSRDPLLVRKAAQMWGSRNGFRCNVEFYDGNVYVRFRRKGERP